MQNPLYRAFIKAGEDAGYPLTDDYNGYQQEGFGAMHMTVKDGVRCSTALAYLKPVLGRPNLTLRKNAVVEKIVFDGKAATGVQITQNGQHETIIADTEIILSAGSIGTPTLLQRSGVGPAAMLRQAGIDVVHDLPGVGENLQDHLEVYFQFRCKQPITLNAKLNWFRKFLIGSRWLINRSGLGATNHFESCAFIRSAAGIRWPNIQFHFLPAAMRYDGNAAFDGHGFQVHVGPNKPTSRGSIKISGTNMSDAPDIRFNYMSTERDRDDWRACLKLTREILTQPAMDAYRGDEIQPAIDFASNDTIDAWVRQNVESAYHPACTCKIGSSDDPLAVLEPNCCIRGMRNLRVVDSSIFPTVTNGNLNAPTIMAAEKAADIIRGRVPLKSHSKYWIDKKWGERQRVGTPIRAAETN
jgi:choline dehydrogenase